MHAVPAVRGEQGLYDVADDLARKVVVLIVFLNQFGRRNLSAYDRSVLALKLKPIIAEKAKENQANHTAQGYQKSDKAK